MSHARRVLIAKWLNTAKDACENECRQAAKNQSVITKFFSKRVEGHGGGKPGAKRLGSAVGEAKRSGDSDERAVVTKLVVEEVNLMVGNDRGKGKKMKETDVPGIAQEFLESKSKESEWGAQSKMDEKPTTKGKIGKENESRSRLHRAWE